MLLVQEDSQNFGLDWGAPRTSPGEKKGREQGGRREIEAQHRLASSPDQPLAVPWSWKDPPAVCQVGCEGWALSHRPQRAEGTRQWLGQQSPF